MLSAEFSPKARRLHELSLALGLLETLEAAAVRERAERVSAVVLRVGALSGVACDALKFCWDVVSEETIAAGSSLRIEDVPLVVFCERCEAECSPLPGAGVVCPQCGVPSPRIVRGREFELVAMEVPA